MKFNSTRMESLVSGDRLPSQATFTSPVTARGSFIARIKRTGFPTKHLGWVDLLLLDSERLALCHSPESENAEENFLMFPLISGAQFGDVKRHGNALTLHAMRVSIILEAEPTDNGDDYANALAGKWTRILNRIISGGSSPDFPTSNSYFGGLGISVNGSKSTSHLGTNTSSMPPKARRLVPQTFVPQIVPSGFTSVVHGSASITPPAPPSMSNSIPNSRSLKRISLCLTGDTDLGFGDDLKTVLTTLDKEEEEEPEEPQHASGAPIEEISLQDTQDDITHILDIHPTKDSQAKDSRAESSENDNHAKAGNGHLTREESVQDIPSALLPSHSFEAPNAPFHEYNVSNTPSPNSLYLATENPPSPTLDFEESPKRVTTILAKEQQQLVQKYGNRASLFTNYLKASSDSQLVISREPPKIPAPMPGNEIPGKSDDSDEKTKSQRNTQKVNNHEASAKKGPAVTAKKTVSISPMVQIIQEAEGESGDNSSSRHRAKSAKTSKGASPSSPRPGSSGPSNSSHSPKSEQKTGFVKVIKRMLGKNSRQKKDYRFSSIPYHRERPELTRNANSDTERFELNDVSDSEDEIELDLNAESESIDFEEESVADEDQGMPTPESVHEKHHAYAELLEPEQSPLSQKFNPKEVVADSTNNSGATTAIPKLSSHKSISALSFRSLSSRSLSSKISDQEVPSNEGSANTTAASTPERLSNNKGSAQPSNGPSGAERCDGANTGSPTLLRRESRQNVHPAPIALEADLMLPISKTLYENSNNSTPALLGKKQSTSAAPVPHMQQPSSSSSNYSLGSRRSLHSYNSSLSSASSYSTPNLLMSDIALFSANLWVSAWSAARWKPMSQLELRTQVLVCDANTVKISVADASIDCKFTPQCEIRKVGNHDVEVKTLEETYMFRGRDPEDAQRFFRTLWTIQANGVQPVATAALTNSVSCGTLKGYNEEDSILQSRRRTLLPPSLSRSNQSLKYAGLSTQTIVEE